MKILVINYFYPPVIRAHAYRWQQLARYWAGQGAEVEVITARVAGQPDCEDDHGVRVCRSGLVAHSSADAGVVTEVSARQSWKSRVVSAVLNMLRPVYRKVYWPDAVYHWLPFLFFQLWKRRHKKYDVIVSYYPMFESLIGGWLWMRMNRNGDTRWIVDYGDPFSISDSQQPNNYAIYRKLNFFVERSVLRSASAVVMLQDNLAARYLAAGLVEREKLHVIPHVVDIDSFYAGEASGVRENKKEIRVVYVGALHKDIREPGKLDLLFKQLNLDDSRQKIVLDMFGRTGGIDVHWSDVPQIRHYGLVSREEASRQMSGADVLLIIGNDNCDMVPSKLTEYVATGRAIISLQGNAPGDESIKRYAKYGRVMEIDKHDPSSWDVDSIRHFIEQSAGTVSGREVIDQVLSGYHVRGVAEAYLRVAGLSAFVS